MNRIRRDLVPVSRRRSPTIRRRRWLDARHFVGAVTASKSLFRRLFDLA